MPDGVSLLLPPCGQANIGVADRWIARLLKSGEIESFWARDVPVAPVNDADVGSLLDPFVLCSYLLSRHEGVKAIGVAVAPVGARTAATTARAAVSVSDLFKIPFRLGIGSGDKPALSAINGLSGEDRSVKTAAFIHELAGFLTGDTNEEGLRLLRSADSVDPTLWLATGNTDLVTSVVHEIDGWMSWQAPLPVIRKRIADMRRLAPSVSAIVTLNVWPNEVVHRAEIVHVPVTTVKLPSRELGPLIRAYRDANADELILNLPVPEEPEQQLEALIAGLGTIQ